MSKKAVTTNLCLISGDDESRISAEAEAVYREFAGENPDEFAVDVLREDDRGPRKELVLDVVTSLKTPPFLGGRKTIWLKNFTGFGAESGSKGGGDPMGLRFLADALAAPLPGDVCLLLSGPGCDPKKPLAKAVEKAGGRVLWCDRPQPGRKGWREEMLACIGRAAELKGIRISPQVSDALAEVLGGDTSLIDCELEKLICYAGGPDREITVDAVREMCPVFSDQQAWALGDPVGKRQLSQTLSVLEMLFAREKDPDGMARMQLNMMARQFIVWLELRLIMAEKRMRSSMDLKNWWDGSIPPEQRKAWRAAKSQLADYKGWRAKFAADNALNYTPDELIDAVSILRDALVSTVADGVPPRVALENALMKIVPAKR
ncbi:MAG: hypothetical protein J6S21_04800 [Victivallales bacterium]|nr:hypothetical protein [Victivallales bacterium]